MSENRECSCVKVLSEIGGLQEFLSRKEFLPYSVVLNYFFSNVSVGMVMKYLDFSEK